MTKRDLEIIHTALELYKENECQSDALDVLEKSQLICDIDKVIVKVLKSLIKK